MKDTEAGKILYQDEAAELRRQLAELTERLAAAESARLQEKENLLEQLEQSQKVEVVGRLAAGVANDFSNMLSVILGHVEIALSWIDSTHHLYEHLQEIYKAAEHSVDLTRQLLIFARKQAKTRVVLDLNVAISQMLKLLRRLIGINIELVWRPFAAPCLVNADVVQLNQVLVNLCVNACEAIEDGGVVTISVEPLTISTEQCESIENSIPGEYVVLRVADTGCGMDEQARNKIFEPFHTTKEHGVGLGLPICREIVRQNGGFITVKSMPGQGSEISVFVPLYSEVRDGKQSEKVITLDARSKPAVLLVDDDVAMLGMVRRMLQKMGFEVFSVERPSEALNLIKTNPTRLDLLLTDLVMPEMNGRSLAKEIAELRPEIKCLFMSGYGEKIIANHGLMDSNVNFIAKPFTRDELLAAVSKVIGNCQNLTGS
jgi:signal transduction histidine kinase/CheY-like chemotaxis protein